MRILLTGGNGMVGRNVQAHAQSASHELIAPGSNTLDLLDRMATERFVREFRPDLIIHAAGRVGGIQANIQQPVRFLTENWDMGSNLVLAARAAGVQRLINLGSSCMYPRDREGMLSEQDVLTGELEPTNEGYALAKIAVARLCQYIGREQMELSYKTLIPCNLYGPYDKFDPVRSHLIPAILIKLRQAMRDGAESVEIWGDGLARREFMYAGDFADALWHAVANYDSLPELMNVGLGEDCTINDYYTTAAAVVGYTGGFHHDLDKPVGMRRKLTNVALARAWGWQAKTSLNEGIALTYAYFLEHLQ